MDYLKYIDTRKNLTIITCGKDFKTACDIANIETPKHYRKFVGSYIMSDKYTQKWFEFMRDADIIIKQ